MAESQTDALVEAARPRLRELGELAQAGSLPEGTTLAPELLAVLFDVNHADVEQAGVGKLEEAGVEATRVICTNRNTDHIIVEVSGQTWTFDGRMGTLLN